MHSSIRVGWKCVRWGADQASPGRRSASSTATFRLHVHRQRAAGQRLTERDSETVESRGPRVPEMPEQQVSLQELESELDRYIHDVENGATVVVSRDGRREALCRRAALRRGRPPDGRDPRYRNVGDQPRRAQEQFAEDWPDFGKVPVTDRLAPRNSPGSTGCGHTMPYSSLPPSYARKRSLVRGVRNTDAGRARRVRADRSVLVLTQWAAGFRGFPRYRRPVTRRRRLGSWTLTS